MGDNDSPARQHSKVGSASDPTQDPAPSGKSNAVGRARPAQEKRRNYAVVAPGSRLPSTKKAVVPSNAFTNASNQSEPQPPMSSISATSDNPMPDMVPGSPIMCLEPALTFASSDALTFGLNILFDSQESQHGQTLLAATEPGAQPPLQDISLHEAASAGNDVGAEKLLMNVPYPQPEEDATSGPRYNPTSLSTQVAPLSLHPTTSTDSTDGRDPPALAATSGSRSLIPMQLDNIRQMRDLDVFDPMEIEYQMAWEDDATEDFFNTGPSDTLLAMYSPTIDIVGTALGIPPEEADVVSEPSPAVDPFDFGSAFFE